MKISILFIALLLWSLTSCKEDENENDSKKIYKIAESNIQDFTVEIYSETEKLNMGFNNVILKFKKDGKYYDVELIKSIVYMNMGEMEHSTPREEPYKLNGEYILPIVFIMPSGVGTYWYFDLEFEYNNIRYKGEPKFEVEESSNLKSFAFNEKKYFVSVITPRYPYKAKTGLNDYTLLVNEQWNKIQFPPVENLEVVMTPWMPNMDHGSPMNENPISVGNGYYEGKVNFTMTGYWTVKSEFFLEGEKIGEVTHSFSF